MPDFEKPTFEYKYDNKFKYESSSYEPERGGCLVAFLVVGGIAQLFLISMAIGMLSNVSTYPLYAQGNIQFALYLHIGLSIAAIACDIGLYNWKSWAYIGIYALYLIGAFISFFVGNPSSAFGAFAGMAILYFLMKDKTVYLN